MRRFKKHWLILTVPFLFWTGAAKADSCPQCSTIWEQVVQTGNQMQQISQGAQNLTALPQQMWNSFTAPLNQMMNLVGNAQGLAYQSINSANQVKQIYGDPSGVLTNYQQKLQGWVSNNQSQIASILQANKINATASMSNAQQIQAISSASQSAVGQLQVMQAANQIAALQANQLQGLQADIQAGNQYMMNYTAAQDQQRIQDANVRYKFYSTPTPAKLGL